MQFLPGGAVKSLIKSIYLVERIVITQVCMIQPANLQQYGSHTCVKLRLHERRRESDTHAWARGSEGFERMLHGGWLRVLGEYRPPERSGEWRRERAAAPGACHDAAPGLTVAHQPILRFDACILPGERTERHRVVQVETHRLSFDKQSGIFAGLYALRYHLSN